MPTTRRLAEIPKPDFVDYFSSQERGTGKRRSRSENAADWMRDVGYNGPSPGFPPSEPPRTIRADQTPFGPRYHCHKDCIEVGVHSTCLIPKERPNQGGKVVAA